MTERKKLPFLVICENKNANQYLSYQIYNQKINKGELSTNLILIIMIFLAIKTILKKNNFRNEFLRKNI